MCTRYSKQNYIGFSYAPPFSENLSASPIFSMLVLVGCLVFWLTSSIYVYVCVSIYIYSSCSRLYRNNNLYDCNNLCQFIAKNEIQERRSLFCFNFSCSAIHMHMEAIHTIRFYLSNTTRLSMIHTMFMADIRMHSNNSALHVNSENF